MKKILPDSSGRLKMRPTLLKSAFAAEKNFFFLMKHSLSSSRSSIRKFIFITLSHAENRGVSKEEIQQRITNAFVCRSVIVAQEMHQEGTQKHLPLGFHFHVAVLNDSASKNNATSIIRKLFPEFEGRQCLVTFHKSFLTMCSYISKEDTLPLVWGEYSFQDILRFAQNARRKGKSGKVTHLEILQQLKECSQWFDVYNQPDIANQLLLRHNNLKKVHADLQVIKMQQASFAERIVSYLHKKGSPQEYALEQLQEKYILLDWIACQLVFNRPIKTKQLFLYGKPSTQKTLILHFLAKAIRIYFASSRINDFTGADDYYDLWIFDEFHSSEGDIDNGQNDTNQQNTLLKVLDGQECRLDSKYREVFHKQINVPIIMIANKMPWRVKTSGPMRERFIRLRFHSQIDNLQEERVIATLWGCAFRRINQQLALFPHNDIFIKYNSANALIKASAQKDLLHVLFPQNDFEECLGTQESATREEPRYRNSTPQYYPFLNLYLQEPSLLHTQAFNHLSLINFALIPLMKSETNTHLHTIPVFKTNKEGASFQVFSPEDDQHLLVWPLYASYVHDELTQENRQSQRILDLPVKINLYSNLSLLRWKAEAETTTNEPPSFPQPYGMWKLHLGVPGTNNNGDWDEDD